MACAHVYVFTVKQDSFTHLEAYGRHISVGEDAEVSWVGIIDDFDKSDLSKKVTNANFLFEITQSCSLRL